MYASLFSRRTVPVRRVASRDRPALAESAVCSWSLIMKCCTGYVRPPTLENLAMSWVWITWWHSAWRFGYDSVLGKDAGHGAEASQRTQQITEWQACARPEWIPPAEGWCKKWWPNRAMSQQKSHPPSPPLCILNSSCQILWKKTNYILVRKRVLLKIIL